MQKKFIFILSLLVSQLAFTQQIESIIEYVSREDSLVKNRATFFNQSGQVVSDSLKWFSDPVKKLLIYKVQEAKYNGDNKISEINYDWYVVKDTNVIRSFSTFQFDSISNKETQICFESDTLIRFVKEVTFEKNLKTTRTKSWEFNPVAQINDKPDLVLVDSIFFDNSNKPIKHLITNSELDGNIERHISYKNDSVYIRLKAGSFERMSIMSYSKSQKIIDSLKMDYKFKTKPRYKYKFTYY